MTEHGPAPRTAHHDHVHAARVESQRGAPAADFLIVGAQRCGTTTLYGSLTEHPGVAAAPRKEVHFFDLNFHRGLTWYDAQLRRPGHAGRLIGEASPYYIFHPHAPRRIRAAAPDAKLIVLLRNPVDRAYSHYQHEVGLGAESLSFEDALAAEESRLRGELDRMLEDERYYSYAHQHYTYLARGLYADQLAVWLGLFRPEQMLIIRSEDLYQDPHAAYRRVTDFLGLPQRRTDGAAHRNKLHYADLVPDARRYLVDYFRPHNARLSQLVGTDLGWES